MTAISKYFDMVVFDWAGTMVDFGSRAPVLALIEAFASQGVPVEETEVRRDMGRAKADHIRAILQLPRVADAWRKAHGGAPDQTAVERLMDNLQAPMMRLAGETAQLTPGAAETVSRLRQQGVKIASCTGYTREMMQAVLGLAADQGYAPDLVVCANETPEGRPSPLMLYKACVDLGVWPLSRVVKVDDAEVGIEEGRNAGCFTVGVAASGNMIGLTAQAFADLDPAERAARLEAAGNRLREAGADLVIDTVAGLIVGLETEAARRG